MYGQNRTVIVAAIALFLLITVLAVGAGTRIDKEERSTLETEDAALRYHYSQLSDREQALYTVLCEGIAAHKEEIRLPERFTAEDYEKVYLLVSMQEPEFFYLDEVYELSPEMTSANMHYITDAETAESMQRSMETAADRILDSVKSAQTEMQKMLTIHDALAKQCMYTEPVMPDSAYTVLVQGMGKCEGYSKAFLYLCRRAGLSAMCVTGNSGRGVKHVWNKAKILGKYYNIDVTWDDDDAYGGQIVHSCFAMPDDMFGDHIPDNNGFTPPPSSGMQQSYYYQNGMQLMDAGWLRTQMQSWAGMCTGNVLEFQCANRNAFDAAVQALKTDRSLVPPPNNGMNPQFWELVTDPDRQVVVIIYQ